MNASSSILCPVDIGRAISEAYDLGAPVKCELFSHGFHDTYRVQMCEKVYFLKIYETSLGTEEHVAFELKTLLHLQNCGLRVPGPIPQRTGQFELTLIAPEGRRLAVLSESIPGESLSHQLTESRCESLGRLLASMHACMDRIPTALVPHWHLEAERLLDVIAPFLPEAQRSRLELLRHWIAQLQSRIASSLVGPLGRFGICHGDVLDKNVLVGSDGVLAILDFELLHLGWRAYDLGTFLKMLIFQQRSVVTSLQIAQWEGEARYGLWQSFLSGYSYHSPLKTLDSQAAYAFVPIRHVLEMGAMAMYTRQFGVRCFPASYFDRGFNFIASWIARYQLI